MSPFDPVQQPSFSPPVPFSWTRTGSGMGRVFLIEPVIGLYAFTTFMIYPLLQQYVYRQLWFQLSGTPYPAESLSQCSNNHSNVSVHQVRCPNHTDHTYSRIKHSTNILFKTLNKNLLFRFLLIINLIICVALAHREVFWQLGDHCLLCTVTL